MEQQINILIVDDEPSNLTVLEALLDNPGYRLVRAGSAEQALLALVSEEFAILILDIRMPGMTGFELAQIIKERKKTAQVPIIFLTAYYNEDQHVLEGYGAGAVDYLHKPVNPTVLRSKVAVFAELHRKNREVESANRAMRSLIEASVDPLVTISAQGKITEVNEASVQATGVSREQLIGTDFSDYFTEPEKVRDGYQRVFSQGFVRDYPLAIRHTSGRITDVLYNASVYKDDKGRVASRLETDSAVLSSLIDITARKEAEAELARKALALERQNRLLDEFAHLVSHDLKAPLRAICHVAEWLRADHGEALGEVGRGHLDLLVERTHQMNLLIQGLLERARAGEEAGRDEAFAAAEAVANVIDILSPSPSISIQVCPMPRIRYDRLHFERILQNLIGNAIQHLGRPDGHLSVEADELPDCWRFAVRDDGVGIADDDRKRIFDMLVTGKPPGKHGTSGVGLAIVRSIVDRHGGRVWVESTLGSGCCFFFTVPKPSSTRP